MKIKLNLVLIIFAIYICTSAYLIFIYSDFQQYLAGVEVVNLTPVAYGVVVFSSILLTLSLFSLFRIPLFHYAFKMLHLWVVLLSGLLLYLYYRYGNTLADLFNANMQQSIAKTFPGTQPQMFKPLSNFIQTGLENFREHLFIPCLVLTIVLAVIQVILYLPSSLRYVYYSHISPVKYTLKHISVSLVVLVPLVFAANLYFTLDAGLNTGLESVISAKQKNINDSDNVFFPLLSLWLPNISDKIAFGKHWLGESRSMVAYFDKLNVPVEPRKYPGYQKLLLGGMSKADQAEINQLYVQWLVSRNAQLETKISALVQKYQLPLKTVKSLAGYRSYQDPVDYTFTSYTEFYNDYSESFLSLIRLYLLNAAIESGGDVSALLKNIADAYYLNIRIIGNTSDSNVKRLFIGQQAVIIQFLYNLLQSPANQNDKVYSFINALPVLVNKVLDQKLIAQKNISLLKQRLDVANQNLSTDSSAHDVMIRYLFKYNKTLNCLYAQAVRKYNLDNKPVFEYLKINKASAVKPRLDNVIGNILCEASMPESLSTTYIEGLETNGRIMILKARSRLYAERINPINYDAYLTNHSDKYFNPLTGGPLKWDRDANQIYFEYQTDKGEVKLTD